MLAAVSNKSHARGLEMNLGPHSFGYGSDVAYAGNFKPGSFFVLTVGRQPGALLDQGTRR